MVSSSLENNAEQALADYLKQRPDQTTQLPQAGEVVKRTGFEHGVGLKRWIQSKPHLFKVQADHVRLAEAPSVRPGFDDEHAEAALEAALVEHLQGNSANLARIGIFCHKRLGLATAGRLKNFVISRPHAFVMDQNSFVRLAAPKQPAPGHASAAAAPKGCLVDETPSSTRNVVAIRPVPKGNTPLGRGRVETIGNGVAAHAAPDMQVPPGFEGSEPARPSRSEDDNLRKAFTRLQGQYCALQLEVDSIKRHLGMPPHGSSSSAPIMNGTEQTPAPKGLPEELVAAPPKTLVLGGHDGRNWVSSSACLTGMKWSEFAPLPSPIAFAGAGSIFGHVYLIGGCDSGNKWLDSVLRRSISEEETPWQVMAPMSAARGSLAVSFCQGAFFAMGGGLPSTQLPIVERYDAIADRWTLAQPLPAPRFGAAAAVVQSAIHLVGGFDGAQYLASCGVLDPREGKWRTLPAEMASKRGNLAACSVGCGQILALGGVDGSGNSVATCELLETRMNRWRGAAPMSEARAFGAVVASACGSKAWAWGGLLEDMKCYAQTMEAYSVQQDSWAPVQPSPMSGACKERAFFASVPVAEDM